MKKPTHLLILLVAGFALGGCQLVPHYGCPAPDGVTCMGPRDVYSATESTDNLSKKKAAATTTVTEPVAAHPAPHAGIGDGVVVESGELLLSTPPPRAAVDVIPEDLPVRTPAKVMRVHLSAWEDEQGNLHSAGRIYTEISPRRWAVGEPAPEVSPHLELMAPLSPQPQVTVPADAPPASPPKSNTPPRRESGGMSPSQDGNPNPTHH